MSAIVDMRVVELLAARLCHELIGPIAAINNGVELLGDEDPEFLRDAVALVGDSARRAARRLQFYRFAYGFGRVGGITGPPPHELADGFFAATRLACDYREAARALPLDRQKLACNLLLLGAEALPRGGELVLAAGPAGPQLEAAGPGAGLAPQTQAALGLATPVGELTSRTVHAYFTGLLARELGYRAVSLAAEPGRLRLCPATAA
jgi:histidine phosphotransferase ChpT